MDPTGSRNERTGLSPLDHPEFGGGPFTSSEVYDVHPAGDIARQLDIGVDVIAPLPRYLGPSLAAPPPHAPPPPLPADRCRIGRVLGADP